MFSKEQLAQLTTEGLFHPSGLNDDIRYDFGDRPFTAVDGRGAQEIDDAIRVQKLRRTGRFLAEVAIADGTQFSEAPWLVEAAISEGANNYLSLDNPFRREVLPKTAVTQLELRGRGPHRALVVRQLYDSGYQLAAAPEVIPGWVMVQNVERGMFAREILGVSNGSKIKQPLAELAEGIKPLRSGWRLPPDIFNGEHAARHYGEAVIRNYMVTTNMAGAKWALDHELPIIYRNYDTYPFDDDEIVKVEPNVNYDTLPLGHRDFRSEDEAPFYAQITSPLRRAVDLVNLLQIGHFLAGKKQLYSVEELSVISTKLNGFARKGPSAKRRSRRADRSPA